MPAGTLSLPRGSMEAAKAQTATFLGTNLLDMLRQPDLREAQPGQHRGFLSLR